MTSVEANIIAFDRGRLRVRPGKIETSNFMYGWTDPKPKSGIDYWNSTTHFNSSVLGSEITVLYSSRAENNRESGLILATRQPVDGLKGVKKEDVLDTLQNASDHILKCRIATEQGFFSPKWHENGALNLEHITSFEPRGTLFSLPQTVVTMDNGKKLIVEMPTKDLVNMMSQAGLHPMMA